jgi:hypothetical protein
LSLIGKIIKRVSRQMISVGIRTRGEWRFLFPGSSFAFGEMEFPACPTFPASKIKPPRLP